MTRTRSKRKRPECPEPDGSIVVIVGRKGCGKSYRTKRVLKAIPRWVAWDYSGEYAELPGTRLWRDDAGGGFRRFLEHQAKHRQGDVRREVIIGTREEFSAFCNWCARTVDLWVVLEEVDRYTSANRVPPGMENLIDRSRHDRINLIAIGHRPASMPRALTFQADVIATGATTEPADLKYWRDRAGLGHAEVLPTLERQQFALLYQA